MTEQFNSNINFKKEAWKSWETWSKWWVSWKTPSTTKKPAWSKTTRTTKVTKTSPAKRTQRSTWWSWWRWWSRGPRKSTRNPRKSNEIMSRTDVQTKATFPIKKWEVPVKIGSLMGLEEVGQCIFIEYEDDMIIVDAGMEFSANETLGADYIIPDIRYVKQNIKKLKWIVLSHGHLDHIGALRDLLPELWFPTIYTTPLTLGIIKKTFDNKSDIDKIKYKIVDPDVDLLKLWAFSIEFCHVNHNIPETMAMAIHTPKWLIFNSSDFKIDHTPAIGEPADLAKIARIGQEWVKLYIWDSLWSQKKWSTQSESVIGKTLEHIIEKATWRIVVATFASNVWRVIQLIHSAIRNNRVIFLSGRSMINNVEICQELWYIKVPKWNIRKINNDIENMPEDRVMILCTWAQWEEFSALARMARNEHPQVTLREWDSVLVSASVIPGNEIQAMDMKDSLVTRGVRLITNDEMDIHASWHGWAEDHKLMLNLVNPEFFLPYYLNAYFRYEHKKLGLEVWIPEENIMMPNENGAIIEMYDGWCKISNEKINVDTVLIDGKWKWHLSGEYVIKARQIMAQDGIVSLVLKIDPDSKHLIGNIQIESRWFVYSSEVRKIHTRVVEYVKSKYSTYVKKRMDIKDIMKKLKEDLGDFLNKEIWRTPMVIPMYVYISRDSAPKAGSPTKKIKEKEKVEEPDVVWMTIEEQWGDEHVEGLD